MQIERQDKKPELHEEEILKNWRDWARKNGFMQENPIIVEVGELSISMEIWTSQGNSGLVYLPRFPRAIGGDVLYIADNLAEMKETVKTLALTALTMIQVKREEREERARLN